MTILRLLTADRTVPHGGTVTYLAEVARPVPAQPFQGTLDDHPLRMTWARPGGPAADLAWAKSLLVSQGTPLTGPAQQVRTWNLSSLWRLPIEGQTAWLKVVPPFFMHEGSILERLRDRPVPILMAHDGPRLLLAEIPGRDLYGATVPQLLEMVTLLVGLQREWLDRTDELLALGLPDWRAALLMPQIGRLVERLGPQLAAVDRAILEAFVDRLPERFGQVEACGLADTLVHGDFHPGNFRGDDASLILLDWGDCGIGHPLLDEPAFLEDVPAAAVDIIREHWHTTWRNAIPGSDAARASQLLRPVAAARQAVIYQGFLDRIEPSERPYHAVDPLNWLRRMSILLRGVEGNLPR